jgi:PAS domain S-box-containing protein
VLSPDAPDGAADEDCSHMAVDPNGFASQAALMVFDDDLQVLCWNEGAQALTGIPAEEAVGRPCWEVIAGRDDEGGTICHRGCSRARIVREGRCLPAEVLHARTATGRRRISLETIAAQAEEGTLFIHVMRDAPAPAPKEPDAPPGPAPQLTPRQRQILELLAAGQAPKVIARQLGLMETTVRNHIRLLFLALGAHSQLEAVARARDYGLI